MTEKDTLIYCKSKIHSLFRDTDVDKISIVPTYDRTKSISDTEKNDKLFVWISLFLYLCTLI